MKTWAISTWDHLATMEWFFLPKPREPKDRTAKLSGKRLGMRDFGAQNFGRQEAELQVRVAALNGLTAIGRTVTDVAG